MMMAYVRHRLFICVLSVLRLTYFSVGFVPTDMYLIDCGSPSNTTVGDRMFVADQSASAFLNAQHYFSASTTAAVPKSLSNTTELSLYQTATIFTETSKYIFPIHRTGRLWIRLYFFPFVYESYDLGTANFSVSAQTHLLLSNFKPTNNTFTVKEYSINVTSNTLYLTFIPSRNSLAFLNALEVVSTPDKLISDGDFRAASSQKFQGLSTQALETLIRVNIGGPPIPSHNDTLWRNWAANQPFMIQPSPGTNISANYISNITAVKYVPGGVTPDFAPKSVYGTAAVMSSTGPHASSSNITWEFNVDPGFQYLVRFHFCDIVGESQNNISFEIYINSWTVAQDADLSAFRDEIMGAPFYLDAVTDPAESTALSASFSPFFSRVDNPFLILNGLEIMKINNSMGNLSEGVLDSNPSKDKKRVGVIVGATVGMSIVAFATLFFSVTCRKRKTLAPKRNSKTMIPASTTRVTYDLNLAYRFPFVVAEEATNNFDETQVIGYGGFGRVYKGVLHDGRKVAIKRSNPMSLQGHAEFHTEIELLSQFRHRHLVSLIGYCDERNEMVLIYEYMENGTLKSHLYGSNFPCLSWKQRLEICIGAARGLHYLHTGSIKPVIHRDMKSTNILLDENLIARVADFGISRMIPGNDQMHVSTAVRGTFGYFDPEYFRRWRLTTKSDVYSFGVVLIEVLCARPVLDLSLSDEMVNLAQWAIKQRKAGQLEQIIDPHLMGKVKPTSLQKFVETAEKCLADNSVDRPSMEEVLCSLEQALQLQEDAILQVDNFNHIDPCACSGQHDESNGYEYDSSGVSSGILFCPDGEG
ncbi:probable receptor-like protein kinase At5g59700 [Malania oleifera]|uniref:probable receptor-like protein kinase At5g59700 n=1 Tax=Malania oleifera TaxID=397392 RepID=UPI0025AEC51B|nr:probable receptor-like protein kinase At5g59700 [Malania oleifera]